MCESDWTQEDPVTGATTCIHIHQTLFLLRLGGVAYETICDLYSSYGKYVCTPTHVTPAPTDTSAEMGEAGSVAEGL